MEKTSLTQEQQEMTEFIKSNPYPIFEKVEEKIQNRLDLWCEYSFSNHMFCKIIYENPTNKDLIVEMGTKIYKMGGMQALLANYFIIKYFSPYSESTNIIVKEQEKKIAEYFKDVCLEFTA